MTIPSNKSNISNEKRSYFRYTLPLNVHINDKGEKREKVCNIGKGGVCFKSPCIFNLNDFVFFHFSAGKDSPLDDATFSILGKVAWIEMEEGDLHKYGAQFKFYNDPFSRQQYAKMVSSINQYVAFSSEYRSN